MGGDAALAGQSKPFDFDVSAGHLHKDREAAGGAFDVENGVYSCLCDHWHMECSKSSDTCTISCDEGTPCVEKKRPPRGIAAGLRDMNRLANQPLYASGG